MSEEKAIYVLEMNNPFMGGEEQRNLSEALDIAVKALEGKHYERAIFIPDGATNGDMIKAMFPNARVDDTSEKFGQLSICTHDAKSVFSSDWWNAPYERGE